MNLHFQTMRLVIQLQREAAEVRECMMARDDEEIADVLMYQSTSLLSTAVALRLSELRTMVAVGKLGNTYLLRGELKLKISRELRMARMNEKCI